MAEPKANGAEVAESELSYEQARAELASVVERLESGGSTPEVSVQGFSHALELGVVGAAEDDDRAAVRCLHQGTFAWAAFGVALPRGAVHRHGVAGFGGLADDVADQYRSGLGAFDNLHRAVVRGGHAHA